MRLFQPAAPLNGPLLGDEPMQHSMDASIKEAGSFEASLKVLYKIMADNAPHRFKETFEAIAEGLPKGGVVFHCTAGKDRTGMITALLLLFCGAARMDVVADYRTTAAYIRPKIATLEKDSPLFPKSLLRSDPETLEDFLDHIESKYGGATAFLKSAGVADETLEAIRRFIVAPNGDSDAVPKRLPFETLYNFRDMVGYPAKGGTLLFGKLFRSDFLGFLPQGDIDKIKAAKVATVIDLRSHVEHEKAPCSFDGADGIDYVQAPLITPQIRQEFKSTGDYEKDERNLFFNIMPNMGAANIGAAVKAVINAVPKGGVVFFCTAGKDRTGVLAALLLAVCGVLVQDIAADYEVSETYMRAKCATLPEGSPLLPKHPYVSPAEAMEQFLQDIGDVRQYLIDAGVSEAELAALEKYMVGE